MPADLPVDPHCPTCTCDKRALRAERDALVTRLHPPPPSDARLCPHGHELTARWECHACAIRLSVDAQAEVERLMAELAAEREKRAAVEARLAEAVLRLRRLRGIADDLRDAISRPPLLAPFLGSCVAQMHEETDRGLLAADPAAPAQR